MVLDRLLARADLDQQQLEVRRDREESKTTGIKAASQTVGRRDRTVRHKPDNRKNPSYGPFCPVDKVVLQDTES